MSIAEKIQLNKLAIRIAKKAFQNYGFNVKESDLPKAQADFKAVKGAKTIQVKVRSTSKIGSYVFLKKRFFNVYDPNLYMVVVYLPSSGKEEIYVVPAVEWRKDIYPFTENDYDRPGLVSKPEWGITFSMKAKRSYGFIQNRADVALYIMARA